MQSITKKIGSQLACLAVFCLLGGISKGSFSVSGASAGKVRKATVVAAKAVKNVAGAPRTVNGHR